MKVVFVSNFFNHHQKSLCDELFTILGSSNFYFIATEEMPKEKKDVGYPVLTAPYVIDSYENKCLLEKSKKIINEADIVIFGSCDKKLLAERVRKNKILFKYSERLFKKGLEIHKCLIRYLKLKKTINKNSFLLCAGSYVANDYYKFGLYRKKTYKWGYFPKTLFFNQIDDLLDNKERNSILWCGRLIDWKHPIDAIKAVQTANKRYKCTLTIIGDGPRKRQVVDYIKKNHCEKYVRFLGPLDNAKVLEHMKKSEIFLMTSDRQEGWGVVVNEAMNSCCCVISSRFAGCTNYLIKHNENGIIYNQKNVSELSNSICQLISNEKKRRIIAKNAYETITTTWSPKEAANRLCAIFSAILKGENRHLFKSGPCSE